MTMTTPLAVVVTPAPVVVAPTPVVVAPTPMVVAPAPDLGVRPGLTRTKMCREWCTTTNTWVDM